MAIKIVDFKEYLNPNSLEVITGYLEPSLKSAEAGERFQFQRLGYFCVDKDTTADKWFLIKQLAFAIPGQK